MIGSAPMTEALFDQVRATFPEAVITNGYGTTEAIASFGPTPRPNPGLGRVDDMFVDKTSPSAEAARRSRPGAEPVQATVGTR